MKRRRWTAAAAIGITATFLLAACGSDDNSSSTSGAPTTAGAATTAGGAATTAAGSATTAAPSATTKASGSAPAATTGGSATASSDLGLIDGVYKGTSGFEIDPKDCPEDWDPKQGITDKEIDLFSSMPTSGPFAGFGLIGDGMKAYFKHINDTGGIDGRSIVLETKDDGYAPDKTKTNVDEAL